MAAVRALATISFTGTLSIDLLTRYSASVRLRETIDGVDSGFVNFRPYDSAALPVGNGFLMHVFDPETNTLLATGAPVVRGQRATVEYTLPTTLPNASDTVVINYPPMVDESAAISNTNVTYTWRSSNLLAAANDLQIGADRAACLDVLASAINGSADYASSTMGDGTVSCPELVAVRTSDTTLSIEARQGGTWGNRISINSQSPATPASSLTYATGGTGNHGLNLVIPVDQLPASLITAPDTARNVHVEIVGLDSDNNPKALIQGPGLLHRTSTVLP